MDFLEEFESRGFLYQCTDIEALKKLMNEKSIPAYIGFDCTAKSLHVGSLMQLMIFRMLQRHGHKPIVIMGGGTTKIGDPSGKDESRKLLNDQDIKDNMQGIKDVISKFIKFGDNASDAVIINNDEWLKDIKYVDFLRDYGRHFSVNRMLSFDNVRLRLEREQNLSFLEFNYMLFQAYDFVELNKRYNCRLQIGGSDQWGNIINGIELNRRLAREDDLYGLTTPLITSSSGAKMGKTANGAVWLSDDMLSIYDYYQFWRNVEDADIIKFMKLFTDLTLDEIKKYEILEGRDINEAKKVLAFEATKICHGEEAARQAEATAIKIFEEGLLGEGLPFYNLHKSELEKGIPAYILFSKSELCATGGDAKRLIKGGGGKINDKVITDPMEIITVDYVIGDIIKLSSGKKKYLIVNVA